MNIKGSIPYFYLYFLHRFKTVGVDGLTANEEVDLKTFVEQDSWQSEQIKLRYKLLKYDSQSTSEKERS